MESILPLLLGPSAAEGPYLLPVLMAIVFAGAFITSSFGVGGGVVMTPLLIIFLPPKFGIGLLGPIFLLISATAVRQYWRQWNSHHVMVILPASLVGIWIGSYFLAELSGEIISKIVGVLALLFGLIQLIGIDRPGWQERLRFADWQGVGLGFASGISSALAHTGGIVFSFYLLPHSRTKEIFVATTVSVFFVTSAAKVGTYFYYGILNLPIVLLSLILIPALVAGNLAGKWINQRIPHRLFIRLISILVALMGIRLVLT